MPGIATGEVYAFPEGKLYLYASASGTTSGSGIGFAQDSTLSFAYGWDDTYNPDGTWSRVLTGQRVEMSIGQLLADRQMFIIASTTGAIHAKFEGLITAAAIGKSAYWTLYSGVVDSISVTQSDNALMTCALSLHAYEWSAVGQ
jgi:hypothetical protein